MQIPQKPPRIVYLATYCPNNTLSSYYVNSLSDTIKLFIANGITPIPLYINDLSSAPVAKNEIILILSNQEYESVVFIDHDIAWDPQTLLSIVNSPYDAAAIPAVKKTINGLIFDISLGSDTPDRDENGFIKVEYASTALFKLSNKLIVDLTDISVLVTNPTNNEVNNVFEVSTNGGRYSNDSLVLCTKIQKLGYNIWINPITTCANIADNVYTMSLLEALTPQKTAAPLADDIKKLYE